MFATETSRKMGYKTDNSLRTLYRDFPNTIWTDLPNSILESLSDEIINSVNNYDWDRHPDYSSRISNVLTGIMPVEKDRELASGDYVDYDCITICNGVLHYYIFE